MDEKEEKVEQLFNTFTISTQLLPCLGRVKKVKAVKEYLVYYIHSRKEMSWEIFFEKMISLLGHAVFAEKKARYCFSDLFKMNWGRSYCMCF